MKSMKRWTSNFLALALAPNFTGGPDRGNPAGSLRMDSAGNLYGTTASGGTTSNGTVFKLTP
jgi:uncharacterized repeat protein (TIGR03803 family)